MPNSYYRPVACRIKSKLGSKVFLCVFHDRSDNSLSFVLAWKERTIIFHFLISDITMLFSQIPLLLIQMCLRNFHLQHIGPVKKKKTQENNSPQEFCCAKTNVHGINPKCFHSLRNKQFKKKQSKLNSEAVFKTVKETKINM